ncbi:MAG: DUF362 domain-containing protein [Candidatus Omnitrophica bacterium]|nr:DUF362 domain-containing protein [Candidatus Omnitrophota bacterium]
MENVLYKLETYLKKQISRKAFLKFALGGLTLFIANNRFLKLAFAKAEDSTGRPKNKVKGNYDLVTAEGPDPYKNTVQAVAALGGMEKFVKKGAVVVIKPNMGWDRTPDQAANTDPMVVAALVEMAYQAGAKKVTVFDVPCNDERRCQENSGIKKAAEEKGAKVTFVDHWNVVKAKFPYKSDMENWPILRDAVECDTFINVPVLKHHMLTGLTLSMKNLMGVCSGTRGLMHVGIDNKLVDITDFMNPDLTVIDATRHLTKNGPSGGNVKDVVTMNKVIASTDPTLADIHAAKLVDKDPMSVPYIKAAVARKFGIFDPASASIHALTSV